MSTYGKLEASTDYGAWQKSPDEDLWVFDKLILSRKCGYLCGPRGFRVPKPGNYIVRPISNIEGMGIGAEITYLEFETMSIPNGFFWSEIFSGDHISVDYVDGEPSLSVIGYTDPQKPLQRFIYWKKIENSIPLPSILHPAATRHRVINCEFIGGKLIEAHLRPNPDFSYGNTAMIPVWPGHSTEPPRGFRFIEDHDEWDSQRVGIFVN